MKKELWRSVEGFHGFYEVSNRKKVRSLSRVVHGRKYSGMELTIVRGRVCLSRDGIKKDISVRKLVEEAFPNNKRGEE